MTFKKDIKQSWRTLIEILSHKRFFIIAGITALILFGILYYFMVSTVANNSLKIAIMMSGVNFIYLTVLLITIMSILFGIYLSLVVFKFSFINTRKGGLFGFFGGIIGAFGVGCPTCGAFLFGLIGAPLALMYFPFKGLEIQILGILLLIISIFFITKSMNGNCRINKKLKTSK